MNQIWRWLPAGALAALTVVVLRLCSTPFWTIALYGVVSVLTVLLPGMLVSRAFRGRPRTLVADVSIGFCTGLALQLVAWALFTSIGLGQVLFLWPLLVIVPMAAVPRLRHVWTLRPYERHLHPVTAWSGVLAFAVIVPFVMASFITNSLPATRWFPDTYWHLSVSAELMHTVTPPFPQLASEPFAYHWFANAHIAAMSLSTGIDPILVVSRLWLFPILLAVGGILMATSDTLLRRTWPGVAATLLLFGGAQIQVGSWFTLPGLESVGMLSPSQVFALPLTIFVIETLAPALNNEPMGRRWWLGALGIAALGGAKSSALPVFVCAAALVLLIALIRRVGWHGPAAVLGMSIVGTLCVSVPLSTAASAGSGFQLFGILGRSVPWVIEYGAPPASSFHEPVVQNLWTPERLVLTGLILVCFLIALAWVLPSWRRLRGGDAMSWFLMGSGIAGFWGMMIVNQDGLSQAYFMRGAMICLCLLAALGLYDTWTAAVFGASLLNTTQSGVLSSGGAPAASWHLLPPAIAGVAWGPAACYAAFLVGGVPVKGGVADSMTVSIAVLAAFAIVTLVIGGLLRRSPLAPSFRVAAAAALVSAAVVVDGPGSEGASKQTTALVVTLIISIAACAVTVVSQRRRPLFTPAAGESTSQRIIGADPASPVMLRAVVIAVCVTLAATAAAIVQPSLMSYKSRVASVTKTAAYRPLVASQLEAAKWVASNVARGTIVATNVHCLEQITKPGCDARSFWVSALGQRPVLLEGWGYTAAAHEAHGVNGIPSRSQPFSDPALLKLNDGAFNAPTKGTLAELYGRGVRYLLADGHASPVKWDTLNKLATHRFGQPGPVGVAVYELKPPS